MVRIRESYEATVPDTLDLAERAKLAVSALVGCYRRKEPIEPNMRVEFYRNPAVVLADQRCNEMWGKFLETILQMRTASGSMEQAELDDKSFGDIMSYMEGDGIHWTTRVADGDDLKYHNLSNGGRLFVALADKYNLEGDPADAENMRKMVKGFRDYAIFREDYAYYPDPRVGGGLSLIPGGCTDTAEPAGGRMYEVGWPGSACFALFAIGSLVHGLCMCHLAIGDADSLDLAERLTRFLAKERFWAPEVMDHD